ncbi:unnamed protein product [Absidia cylindrospora]
MMTSMTTTTIPMMNRKRKQPETDNWEKELQNGYPAEVIVIENSPTPPPHDRQLQQQHLATRLPLTGLPDTITKIHMDPPTPSASNNSNDLLQHGTSTTAHLYPTSSSPFSLQQGPYPMYGTVAPSTSQAYATASAAAAAFQACNKRRLQQEDIASKRSRKDLSYLGLDHAGQYSTNTTNGTPTTTSAISNKSSVSNIHQPLVDNYDDKDGHYIIKPNESLTARYKIMRLLGQGTFGKVVECYDRVRRTFCAVKVIRAIPKYRDASKIEIRVLNTLKEHDPLNLNKCIHLMEWFDYRNHICMVFELLGQSVFDFLKSNHFKPFPSDHIQQFAKQLLTSVAFIHDLKLIHTDLKPENILLVNHVSHSGPSGNKQSLILQDTDIRLIDFGSATFEQDYHSTVVSTRHYRAPEIILGMGWSYPCDVWSIGCILVEFFTGDTLFHTHDNLEHLAMMEAVIGDIPPHLTRLASREGQKFFKDTKLRYPDTKTTRQSRQFVRNMKPLHVSKKKKIHIMKIKKLV